MVLFHTYISLPNAANVIPIRVTQYMVDLVSTYVVHFVFWELPCIVFGFLASNSLLITYYVVEVLVTLRMILF